MITRYPACVFSLLQLFLGVSYAQQATPPIATIVTDSARQDLENTAVTRPTPTPVPVLVAADADGFQLSAIDESYSLRLRGDVQADGRFFSDADPAPGSESFYLRRVRVVFQGTLFSRFDFKIMPNFGMGRAELQDAYLDARFTSAMRVRAGKFKLPVGLEFLQSPTNMMFIERAYPSSLVPNRDVGVEIHGSLLKNRFSYQVGVFNGSADGASIDADLNNSKDIAARVFVEPFRASSSFPLKGLGLGMAVTSGIREGNSATPDLPSFRTSGHQTFFRYLSGTDAGSFASGRHSRIVPQGYYYQGRLGLLGEYVFSRQEVRTGDTTARLTHRAWQVAGSFVLTGEEATYGRLQPLAPYDGHGHWGAFEIVGRLHRLRLDDRTFPAFADPESAPSSAFAWGVGVNWYANSSVRFSINYEQTSFDTAGSDTVLDTEHLLLTRFQIAF